MQQLLKRVNRRLMDRIRGEANLERLVAQGMELGVGAHIARPVYLDTSRPWLITIGAYANLGTAAIVLTHDPSLNQHSGVMKIGRVDIGDRVMIGVGAIILPGTTIGEDSVIAAGSVVRGEIPPRSLVSGNPGTVSKIGAAAVFQRADAARSPSFPVDEWPFSTGLSRERRQEQKDALAGGASGYVPTRPSPGSPFSATQQKD